jgi:hypothetical protein
MEIWHTRFVHHWATRTFNVDAKWKCVETPLVTHPREGWLGPRTGLEHDSFFTIPLTKPLCSLTIICLVQYDHRLILFDKAAFACES